MLCDGAAVKLGAGDQSRENVYEPSRVCHAVLEHNSRVQRIKQVASTTPIFIVFHASWIRTLQRPGRVLGWLGCMMECRLVMAPFVA